MILKIYILVIQVADGEVPPCLRTVPSLECLLERYFVLFGPWADVTGRGGHTFPRLTAPVGNFFTLPFLNLQPPRRSGKGGRHSTDCVEA